MDDCQRKRAAAHLIYGLESMINNIECLQAVLVPFVGILGNLYNRVILIAAGTILWGAMSSGMGFANNYAEVQLYSPHSTHSLPVA